MSTTFYVQVTYTNQDGESLPSSEVTQIIASGHSLIVDSPVSITGVNGWNVYVGTTSGGESKQNLIPILIGSNWTEPSGGIITGGVAPPSVNTAQPGPKYKTTVLNINSGRTTITPPSGTTLNGSTASLTLGQYESAEISTDGAGNYYSARTIDATHAEVVLDGSGNPVTTASGDWLYLTGIAN